MARATAPPIPPALERHTCSVLSRGDVEAIARRTVALLREQTAEPLLVDAAELARRLSVPASWVYRHADELGAVRLGDGPKAGVRFDPAEAAARLAARRARERPVDPPRRSTSRERRQPTGERTAAGARLLPIRGREDGPVAEGGC